MEWIQQYGRYCRDCEYWEGIQLSTRKSNDFKGRKGNCHRFPPVNSGDGQCSKPVTLDSDGCGEFKLVIHLDQDHTQRKSRANPDHENKINDQGEDCLINATQLAEILNIGSRHVHSMRSSGQLPLPIKLGGSVRWHKKEILKWIEKGCPSVSRWENIQKYE